MRNFKPKIVNISEHELANHDMNKIQITVNLRAIIYIGSPPCLKKKQAAHEAATQPNNQDKLNLVGMQLKRVLGGVNSLSQ